MKTKIKRVSKSTLAVILAIMMVFSTMLVGTISVNAAVTTLYVTGDAAGLSWGSWKELTSKTADNSVAYTSINGNQRFKVSKEASYDIYGEGDNAISIDNSLGNVTINGELAANNNLSTSNTADTIYICVQLSTGKVYASTTEPSASSGSKYTVTVKSKLNVTNDISGTALFTATTDGTETSETVTGSTFTLTASDTDTNYNFAGWKLDGVTLTSGTTASKTISFTIKSGAENPTVTATAITLTPRLRSVTKTDLIYNATTKEKVTLHAYSKVGDKTEKATNYKVTYYYLKDSSTTPVKIGETQEITDVTKQMYADANADPENEANHIVGGTNTKADVEFAPTETGTYKVFAEIAGYDDGGNLVTGAYEVRELGTTLFKDDIVINVTDGSFKLPIADNDRIYAYAKTLAENETPSTNAWVASETNAAKIDTHTDRQTVKPTLGKTTDSNIRIFLPTTASSDKVLLYNTFSSEIKVKDKNNNDVTINAGEYKEVSYTPNASTTVTLSNNNTKTLTIYKSTADGALYVNNIGTYASIDDNGALSMIDKLYSGKEEGEIKSNVGALADSNGVQNVTVSKIKGRGNSTWVSANKKSFNVNFSENIKAFGFTTGKKFSLLANFKDPSLSRNKILYELADKMGVKYTSDSATVDLYLNGLYMGSYLMCQKVEVGKNELVNDLGKTLLDDLYKDSATGKVPDTYEETIKTKGFSFLIELDSNADKGDFYITVDSQKITIKEPEYLNDDGTIPTDVVTKAAQYFVQEKYKELFNAMSDTTITNKKLNEIIDVDSLAKYYLINEIAKNYDIGVSSTYLVYNYTAKKFYISPLWDMDVTTGNCKSTESDYQSYEGNWTDNNSSYNYFMKKVFDNPQVQSAARKLWTNDYYTTLLGYLSTNEDNLTTKALSVAGSLNCNYVKWDYPYGFQGGYDDDVQARTELNKATYDPATNTYTVSDTKTKYLTDAEGQIKYVSDWLQSRIAWMSKKYNTYTIGGLASWDIGDRTAMTNQGNGIHYYEFKTDPNSLYGFKIFTDYGLSNTDITVPENSYNACINFDPDVQLINNTTRGEITAASGENKNFGIRISGAQDASVFLIYNQVANTLTLSDTLTTITKPSVKLSGSTVANENIDAGTPVTLTAKVSPATKSGSVLTGTYTVDLYRDGSKVTGQSNTVTFADGDTTKDVSFTTALVGKSQSYTVKVSYTYTEGATTLTGDSAAVEYKQAGLKDQKIYFDPSTWYESDNKTSTWKKVMTTTSTVTATVSGLGIETETFTMSIDTDDIHGFDKGVFVANITAETLAKLQNNSNSITFTMVGTDGNTLSATTTGDENIKSGWIYNYTNEQDKDGSGSFSKRRWEAYNVAYNISYPNGDIKSYDDFKKYLAAQVKNDTDHIIYFDNSASQWYNVYLYTWDASGNYENCVQMTKLPYADIWYYDFGESMRTERFLFKDRSDKGFGSDFQQTVDLVDGFVEDAAGTHIPINFTDTLSKVKNPIFITDKFEKITEQNAGGYLKFRAFNTKWQEFNEVVLNAVQTKAVDIYFDLHGNASTNPDTMSIYHESKTENYKFSSPSTTLTKLPGSTIYYARLNLPYTDAGELMFKFTRFVAGTTIDKTMGDNAQPAFTCINTGEVWYEYAPSGITYGNAETTSILPLAKPDASPVSASETNASVAADEYNLIGGTTIYLKPNDKWLESNAVFYADFFGTTGESDHKWIKLTYDSVSGAYAGTIPTPSSGTGYENVIFFRYDPSSLPSGSSGTGWIGNAGGNKWTQSGDITSESGMNMYTITSANSSYAITDASWSAYSTVETTTEYCLRGSGASINGNNLTWVNGFSDTFALSDTDGDGIYTVDVKITDGNGKLQFEVFGKNGSTTTTYKASSGEPNMLNYSESSPFETVTSGSASMFIIGTNGLTYTIYLNTNVTGNPKVWATLATQTYSVTVDAGVSGVTVAPTGTVDPDTTVTITPTDENQKVSDVSYTSASSITIDYNDDGTATFTMPSANVTIDSVTLVAKTTTYSVTVGTGVSGVKVTPSADITAGTSVKITPNDSTKKISAVTFDDTTLTYSLNAADGSATFTMPSKNVTITGVTLEDKPTTYKEYCGVLGYNHSTATFASTVGGIIKDAYVNLINGYQNNTTAIKTGYTTVTDGVYTVIYALTSTGALAETAKTNNVGVTESTSDYEFNGWLKDNQPILGTGDNKNYTYSEEVSGTSTVEYVASWSKLLDKIYKFTYKYLDYDKATYGIEYAGKDGTVKEALTLLNEAHTTYTINVNLPGNASVDDIKNAYINRAPKLQSDYFIYSFDINGVTVNEDTLTAEAEAKIDSVKSYKVSLTNDFDQNDEVFYQKVVTLTVSEDDKASLTSDKTLKWTDRYGNTLFIGNTYTFRVTKDVTVSYEFIDKTETINSTYVNEPTYEFYTTNTGVEKIRFNIRVDNIVAKDTTVAEYGIIRFLTDENGKPLDSTVSQDKNISKDTLMSLVQNGGNASVTVYKIKKEAVNEEKKYIYAPSMTNNATNREKYMRVFSYIKTSDGTIVVSDNSVIVSIKNAI